MDHNWPALVTIEQHNSALLFSSFLKSQHIVNSLEHIEQGYCIRCPQNDLAQASLLFEQFIINPHHPRYQQAAWLQGETSVVSNNSPSLVSVFKEQFLAHAGILTLVVFVLCWLVFIASLLGWHVSLFKALRFFSSFDNQQLFVEPYRLLTPVFLHFSWLHIVFNTMWWWQLAGNIEHQLGKGELLNLFLISGLISNVGQFWVSGANFGGLSGVVYGLMGYVWWLGWLAPEKGLSLSKPIVVIVIGWMLLGFVDLLPVDMANTAHLLGLLCGCALAWIKAQNKTLPKQ